MEETKAFKASLTDVRKAMAEMLAVKKKKQGDVSHADIAPIATSGALKLAKLKATTRATLLAVQEHVTGVVSRQGETDTDNLQLENLRYEEDNLRREIAQCKNFSTSLMDRIDLMPVTEFQETAPETLRSVSAEKDPHAFQMNRLAHELELRKAMSTELDEMAGKKQDVLDKTLDKSRFLEGLPGQLKAIEKATAPLQRYFSVRASKTLKRQTLSAQLEGPLYLLFRQLEALEDDEGNTLQVAILAKKEAAGAGDGDSRKRAREEDDEDRGAKRRGGDADGAPILSAAELMQASTLSVVLILPEPHPIKVLFSYLPHLRVITVDVEGQPPQVLNCLLPGDTGEETPRLSNVHKLGALDASGGGLFPPESTARPYHWAQWLGGLYLLPPSGGAGGASGAPRMEPSTRRILDLIRTRVVCRSLLEQQLAQLAASPPTVSVQPDVKDLFPASGTAPLAELLSWEECHAALVSGCFAKPGGRRVVDRSEPVDTAAAVEAKGLYAPDDDLGDEEGVEVEAAGTPTPSALATEDADATPVFGCRYFRAVFGGAESYLQALVEIAPDYPSRPPRFRLAKLGSATSQLVTHVSSNRLSPPLENLAHDLNALAPTELCPTPASEPYLLHHMIHRIQTVFPRIRTARYADHKAGRVRRGRDRTPALLFQRSAFVYR